MSEKIPFVISEAYPDYKRPFLNQILVHVIEMKFQTILLKRYLTLFLRGLLVLV